MAEVGVDHDGTHVQGGGSGACEDFFSRSLEVLTPCHTSASCERDRKFHSRSSSLSARTPSSFRLFESKSDDKPKVALRRSPVYGADEITALVRGRLFRLWGTGVRQPCETDLLERLFRTHSHDPTLISYRYRQWWLYAVNEYNVGATKRMTQLLRTSSPPCLHAATTIKDDAGRCALHVVAEQLHRPSAEQQRMLAALQASGQLDVNVRDARGYTPLHTVCAAPRKEAMVNTMRTSNNRTECIQLTMQFLIQHRADVNLVTKCRWLLPDGDKAETPLTLAAENKWITAPVLEVLVAAGANVCKTNGAGCALLDVLMARWCPPPERGVEDTFPLGIELSDFVRKVRLCLENGSDVYLTNGRSLTSQLFHNLPLLHWADYTPLLALLEILFAFGSDVAEAIVCQYGVTLPPLCYLNWNLSACVRVLDGPRMRELNDRLSYTITHGLAVARQLRRARFTTLLRCLLCADCRLCLDSHCASVMCQTPAVCRLVAFPGVVRIISSYSILPVPIALNYRASLAHNTLDQVKQAEVAYFHFQSMDHSHDPRL